MGDATSPFRYPGGKGFLTPFLSEQIHRRFGWNAASFAEPFCGGAGSALNLLSDERVEKVYLNDVDFRIFSAWKAMLDETDRFVEQIHEITPSIKIWEDCLQKLYEKPKSIYSFDVGFATFFVNRTSRSGVILGSGPIGGYNQGGKWKIDARFKKDSLIKRIQYLGEMSDRIFLSCLDGLEFCRQLENTGVLHDTLLFIDPPYVQAGGRLYYDGMNLAKHDALANWLLSGNAQHWILTYDDHEIIRDNYSSIQQYRIQVRYSLGKRRLEQELLYMS
ncbi:MAG: DNA adenine methylase [Alphaproteobacteria bacterium]|nr:DNA adenine methylase [Alphaproteobacteria bacterium]